ncbi:MAG: hypothetical protein KAI47_24695 [Deltaproteobacteria bacterium]|nr:hypothetical protein [Deltaproteobacteria bacterium]
MDDGLRRLRDRIGAGGDEVVGRWLDAARQRCWRLRDTPVADQLRRQAGATLESLAQSLAYAEALNLGEPVFREPIQRFSFIAGWMAGTDLPVSAALALCHGLRDLTGDAGSFYDWLLVVVAEAYMAGVDQAASARHRQIIEKSQIVCELRHGVIALFLVGDPDREALDDAVGRLMMLTVMRDARAVVVDAAGLIDPAGVLEVALGFLTEHRAALKDRQVRLTGVDVGAWDAITEVVGYPLTCHAQILMALDAVETVPGQVSELR